MSYGPCNALGVSPQGLGAPTDPPDFTSSAVPMWSADYIDYTYWRKPASGTNWGEAFQFPLMAAPVVMAYRQGDFPALKQKRLQFSTWTFCAILNHTITNWNDPAITADNGTSVTGGVSRTIPLFISFGGGINYALTNYLTTACGTSWRAPYNASPYQNASGRSAAWMYGAQPTWNGPGCNPANWECSPSAPAAPNVTVTTSSDATVAAVQVTKFSLGTAYGQWAASAKPVLAQALLQSAYPAGKNTVSFADPTNHASIAATANDIPAHLIQYGVGADGPPLAGDTRPDCAFFINPATAFAKTPVQGYPLMAIDYMLFYGNNNGVHTADKKTLVEYLISAKAAKIINSMEYTTLDQSVNTAVSDAIHGTGSHPSPCMQ